MDEQNRNIKENTEPDPYAGMTKKERIVAKKRRRTFKRIRALVVLFLILALIISSVVSCNRKKAEKAAEEAARIAAEEEAARIAAEEEAKRLAYEAKMRSFEATSDTVAIGETVQSSYAILVDLQTHDIIAWKDGDKKIYPASMTKILSLLVAAENINQWDQTFEMTMDIQNYCYVNKCSNVGFVLGEKLPLSEMPYGTILTSGADATLTLANAAAGSHEAFVELMNKKLEEMGISNTTHFDNAVGIYSAKHYTTVKDIAIMMFRVMENDFCKEVMETSIFKTEPTNQHQKGQDLVNQFVRKIQAKDCGIVSVTAGKTGYVAESGYCAVSYAEGSDGKAYICVTADSTSSAQTIDDHAAIYKKYIK